MNIRRSIPLVLTFAASMAACSSGTRASGGAGAAAGGPSAGSGAAGTSAAGTGAVGTSTGTTGTGAGTGTGTGGGSGGATGTAFVYGLNLGYYNSNLNDTTEAALGMAAGADSHRHKLTEVFLDQWGTTVHVSELQAMIKAGEREIVCNLIGPAAANSNAPPGGDTEEYSPKNLYEPIFTTSGDVNPANTWAAFVQRVVSTYSPYIHTWEVWNEPDQVGGNWQATETWDTQPPKPSDLIWWNDTIFAYIRLLRVTFEVVHKLDPQGKVTLGGIGYASFLDAILRYTDEPTAGAVTSAYPQKGSAYFDVVSFHYYPIFGPGNSDVGAAGLITEHDQLQAELTKASVTGKPFIITETGAPRYAVGGDPGGTDYAKNYLLKAMAVAQNAGIGRIDWFILGDSADPGASTNPDDYMGLYQNLTNVSGPSAAVITETGTAYATLGHLLADATSDPTTTKALALPSGTDGVALRMSDQKHAYVVWATTNTAGGETATGTVTLPAAGAASVYAWDYSMTMTPSMVMPSGGMVQVAVTSAPVVVIAP
jgi:hypothetical protein